MQRNRWSKSIRNCDNYWPGLFSLPQFRESRVPACIPATPDPTFGRFKKKRPLNTHQQLSENCAFTYQHGAFIGTS